MENNDIDDDKVESVYNNHYFRLPKQLQEIAGIWPYSSGCAKKIRCIIIFISFGSFLIPLSNGCRIWCGVDIDLCSENASGVILVTGMFLKGLVLIIHRDKLKIMLNKIATNWYMLSDPEERKIILEYAALGKLKSVGYFVYIASTGIMFTQGPLFPVFLDLIKPLNESREKIQILNAEYIIDPIENYYKIYAYLCVYATCTVILISGIDGFYTVIVHQYLAILAIVKYRLQIATKSCNVQINRDYNIIVDAILLHQESLLFNEIINATYSTIFLVANIFTIMYMCVVAIVIVNVLEDFEIGKDLFELVRMNMFLIGALIHLLYLTWPGQSILSQSEDLLVSAYANEWYNISQRSKKLLKILMLRLAKPSVVTAGGISVMNFESYGAILKSAASYLTVLLSFRN